ncbi:hypothetical protein IWW45_003983 [Coemansia sp. RSA 485]|nr:hypothetical protein IWW45_003983 [Coemansia sp. RSA 485]
MKELDSGSLDYVRELAIIMENESGLMEGVVNSELFGKQKYGELRFCSVTKVSVVFRAAGVVNGNSWSTSRCAKVMDNVLGFCRFVQQMVPRMQRITVVCERQQVGEYKTGTDILYTGIMDCMAPIVDSSTFFYDNTSHTLSRVSLQAGLVLTEMDYRWHPQTHNNFFALLYENKEHLGTLTIKDIPDSTIVPRLFADQRNRPMAYPQLKKLCIYNTDHKPAGKDNWDQEETWRCAEPVFPMLQYLQINGVYPVTNDVCFRGNCHVIQTLSLFMDPELTGRFLTERLIPFQWLSNLRHLCLHTPTTQSQMETAKTHNLIYQLLLILPRELHTLELRGNFDYPAVSNRICNTQQDPLANIQTVVMRGPGCTSPTMRDIIRIIKHLPSLTTLHSGISQIGFSNYMDESMLPNYCIKTYTPMPRYFKCWTVVDCTKVPVQSICLTAVILAIICPEFTFAALPLSRMPKYSETVRMMMDKEAFRDYAASIGRLIFTGK